MKKTIILLLILILALTLFVGCKKEGDSTVVTPKGDIKYEVSFESPLWDCTVPEAMTVTGGEKLSDLPFPENVIGFPEYFDLAWYVDEDGTQEYIDEPILADTVLYLGAKPKTYSLTYEYDESLVFEGEFPSSYVYGEETPLPTRKEGKGYHKNGKWVYGDGETDFFTNIVSSTIYGDLHLEYKIEPIVYDINYRLGSADAVNPNASTYDVTMGEVLLLPAECEGKEFDRWVYDSTNGHDPLIGTTIEKLDIDLVSEHYFTLTAVWKK